MSHYSSPQEQHYPHHNHHNAATTVSSGNSHHHNMTKLPSPSQLMNSSYSPQQQQQQQQQNNLPSITYLSPYETTTSHHNNNNNNNNSKKRYRSPDFDSSSTIYYQQQHQQQQYYEPQQNQQHYNRYPSIASSSSNQQLQNHHQHQSSYHHHHHHVAVDDNDDQYGAHHHSQKRARYHQQTHSPSISASSTSSPRNDHFGSSPITPHAHVIKYRVDWQQEKLACERYGPPPDYYAVVSSNNGSNNYSAVRGGFMRFSDNPPSRPTASAVMVPEISTIASYSAPTAASSSVPHPHHHHHVPISASSMNNSNMPHALTQQQANSATIVAPVNEHGVESTMIVANKRPIVPPVRDPLSIDSHLAHQPKKQFLPPSAVEVLKDWFYSHINYPYPTTDDRNHLSDVTGLSNLQITNWFTNERKRKWTPKMKKQQMQMKEAGVIATPWNPRTTRKKASSPGDQNSASSDAVASSSSEGGVTKESASVDGQSTVANDSRPQQEQLATNSEE